MPNFQLDQTVYFQDKMDGDLCYGTIASISRNRQTKAVMLGLDDIYVINTIGKPVNKKYSQATVNAEDCCDELTELKDWIRIKTESERDVYRNRINSVEDLIHFVLNNDVSGQSFNVEIDDPHKIHEIENKRAVFVEKATELLGLQNLQVELSCNH